MADLEPESQRRALADEVDDPELRREAAALLAADLSPSDPVGDAIEDVVEAGDGWRAPSGDEDVPRCGPYRLLERIGQGGLGAVYLAERADGQFERRVAVKVVRRDLISLRLLEDLRLERQLLAGLEHPHIARLYDGGADPSGQPYLAMEYVDGLPIDRYAEDLPFDARLELFFQVASAVAYAHASLVIHRDLKPSNILVTADGVAKLLDFGIARPLDPRPEAGPDSGLWPRRRLFTPEYASPEQIAGAPLTTASDVYSLGVLLYRLLAGRLPHPMPSKAAPDAWAAERATREAPPLHATADDVPWAGRLAGDLSAILSKALALRVDDRFRSVDELTEELRRYLDHRPVLARNGSSLYRLRRFLRRHRLAAVATLVVILSLATGLVMVSWSLQEARAARATAEAALARIEIEQRRSTQLIQSFVDLFRTADPGLSGNRASMPVSELIDREVEFLQGGAPLDELTPFLATTFAQIYLNISAPEQALGLLSTVELDSTAFPPDHRLRWERSDLMAEAMIDSGDEDEAAAFLRGEIRRYRRQLGHGGESLARLVHTLGVSHLQSQDLAAATFLFREALRLHLEHAGGDSFLSIETRHRLAQALLADQELDAAEAELHRVLDYRRGARGESHPRYLTALGDLAVVAMARRQDADAIPMLARVLDGNEQIFGPEHPHVAVALQNLATATSRSGSREQAQALWLECLALRRQLHPEDHPALADALFHYARFLHTGSQLEKATVFYNEASEIRRQLYGEGHRSAILSDLGLADLAWSRGRFEEALERYRQIVLRLDESGARDSIEAAYACLQLGKIYLRTDRASEAEPWLMRAEAIAADRLSAGHPFSVEAAALLAALQPPPERSG
ncbi:MAG: serine/threonine-protein kinase [Acidobacteriota bacterium]